MTPGRLYGLFCYPHKYGVRPDAAPFFHPGCRTCREKLAAGKVTGAEPLPPTLSEQLAIRGGKGRRVNIMKARRQPWAG